MGFPAGNRHGPLSRPSNINLYILNLEFIVQTRTNSVCMQSNGQIKKQTNRQTNKQTEDGQTEIPREYL